MRRRNHCNILHNPPSLSNRTEVPPFKNYSSSTSSSKSIRLRIYRRSCLDMFTKVTLFLVLLPHMAQTKRTRGSTRSPQFMNDEMQNHTVRVGSEATFSCTVEHLNTYKVAWLHSEKGTLAVYPTVISHNNRISVRHDNRHAYYLHLRDIQESDAGKYICQLNTDPAISVRGSLNVVVPPDIIDEESSSDTLATEGMAVTLVCKARGNPRTQIAWRREDGKSIRLCHPERPTKRLRKRQHHHSKQCREVSVHYGTELSLPHVSRHDSGVYFCLASNGVPPTVSKKVRLYVDFPPTLWITHQSVPVSVGSSAELECLTAAHPPSLNFWSRDGKYVNLKEGRYQSETIEGKPAFYNIRMKLKIFNVSESDFGKYQCKAKNTQGETTGDIELYELPKPSTTTTIVTFFEEPGLDIINEIPRNQTKVILLDDNVPIKPDVIDFEEQNNRHRFRQQSQSNSRSTDTKGFHRNGDNSDFEKRFGLSDGTKMSVSCQKYCALVLQALIIVSLINPLLH